MREIIHRLPDGTEIVLGRTKLTYMRLTGTRGWAVVGAKADKVFKRPMPWGADVEGLMFPFVESGPDKTGGVVGLRKERTP